MEKNRKGANDLLDDASKELFDKIYATDLVYTPGCWELCGDAHCCSFSRYKRKFKLIGRAHFQELPLLPGEYQYLEHKGWLGQFGDFDHNVTTYALDRGTVKVESIVSRKPDCACYHDTRPTVCRLYPLLPTFDIDGRLTGIENFGIYEELEKLDDMEPACQLTTLPFEELQKFLTICSAIGQSPKTLYYLCAYRLTKEHIRSQLAEALTLQHRTAFEVFEKKLLRNKLIDNIKLKADLTSLAENFRTHYGNRFQLKDLTTITTHSPSVAPID